MRRPDLPSLLYAALYWCVLAGVFLALPFYALRRKRPVPGEYYEHLERDF